ncbi:hypothetical protein DVR12_23790 [Chitinophaga silvatica]|uniref:Uncharacterized protein n=1 Tax=Chitinophaga silvatica TaxID=2282649 RepID=A0A3E1Y3I8_9BACT|nr:hypothetical protein [Chitinophaga silvatica]RFS19260.1 hypothetical protein DVR12_23790 [Chitinophaga silvatica]
MNSRIPTVILSLALIGCYFLPWLSISGFNASLNSTLNLAGLSTEATGWTFPLRLNDGGKYAGFFMKDLDALWLKLVYVFYLIPVLAAFNTFKRMSGQRPMLNEFLLAIVMAGGFYYWVHSVDTRVDNIISLVSSTLNPKLSKLLAVGYFAFIGVSVFGLYYTVMKKSND